MNFEILKKAFPQVVINSLFALLFIFVIAFICVLHTNATAFAADEQKADENDATVKELYWTAPGFLTKLTKQCPDLSPTVFELAAMLAKSADKYYERVRVDIKRKLKQGRTKEQAESAAYRSNGISPLFYRGMFPPKPPQMPWPSDMTWDEWGELREEWEAERDRVIAEKERSFKSALREQCPQIPTHLLELAYEEEALPGRYTESEQ